MERSADINELTAALADSEEFDDIKYEWSIEGAIKAAIEAGFTVIRSTPETLLLDLDSEASMDTYKRTFPRLVNLFTLAESSRWESKGGNTHIVLTCAALPFPSRVALHLALGSDPVRETLALAMYRDGIEEPSVLFKPYKAKESK